MFFKLLNKIRKKPEPTRQLITLGASIVITCVIAASWAVSFIPEANSILGKAKPEDIIGPFSKLSEKLPAAPDMDPKLMEPSADSQVAGVAASGVVGGVATSTATSTPISVASPSSNL